MKAMFHYMRMWEDHPAFDEFVKRNWEGLLHVNPLMNFALKLKRLRQLLTVWNWEVFGDVRRKLRDTQVQIDYLEGFLQNQWDARVERDLVECHGNYEQLLGQELAMLKEKARLNWLVDGDALKVRRYWNKVNILGEDGSVLSSEELGKKAAEYYQELFSQHTSPSDMSHFGLFGPCISEEENADLCRAPSMDEVHGELLEMDGSSAPGHDGFTGRFYVHFWEMVKDDLVAAVEGFFQGLQLPAIVSSTFITLLPKAYDRVSLSFILNIFRASGFSEAWCDLIYRCISNSWYSVKWGGKCHGFFKSYCGVRQGDPLSPSLFLIAMEWFSRSLNATVEDGRIYRYYSGPHVPSITHLLFADDLLIFTNGSKRSMENLMCIINEFCQRSGQRLNNAKSLIFFPKEYPDERKSMLLRTTGFSTGHFPVMYLGAPLFVGCAKIEYFQYLEDKVKRRIGGWMKNLLSMGGKITLINSVLNSTSLHCMAVLPVPKTILGRLTRLFRDFLWD
ncbi:hypothetical protein QQ045_024684 [Rhodiola kirilowii]